MKSWNPEWMDVTWGAGGSTSDLTPEICNHIQNNVKGNCMMHLTCTNMKKEKIDIALSKAKKMGLRNILALRGDPPEGEKEWKAGDSAFTCALDLIKYIKSTYGDYFGITISGYPEGHPIARKKIKLSCDNWDPIKNEPFYWAPRKDEDGDWEGVSKQDWIKELDYLKAKVDAGGQVCLFVCVCVLVICFSFIWFCFLLFRFWLSCHHCRLWLFCFLFFVCFFILAQF